MGIVDHGDVRPEALVAFFNGIPITEATAGAVCGMRCDYSVALLRRVARELEDTESQ